MDPAEVALPGPGGGAVRGSRDPGRRWCCGRRTGPRPTRDGARACRRLAAACRRQRNRTTTPSLTDTPFGTVLRAVAASPARHDRLPPSLAARGPRARPGCRSCSTCVQRREPPTVVFPAVRYLVAGHREHQRRLRLRHWLLLLLRTLLIVALVLAAAGPTVARAAASRSHAPSALVLVLDNSAQQRRRWSAARRASTQLARAARRRARARDAGRRALADRRRRRSPGAAIRPRCGRRWSTELRALAPRRLDLGRALPPAGEVLPPSPVRGEIVLLTDLPGDGGLAAPTRACRCWWCGPPSRAPPRNVGIAALAARHPAVVRSTAGGAVSRSRATPARRSRVTLAAGRPSGAPGAGAPRRGRRRSALAGAAAGWWPVTAELEPDEFRPTTSACVVRAGRAGAARRALRDPADRYRGGRCDGAARQTAASSPGDEITMGGSGPAIVDRAPPADPAALGALNRALERRGVAWTLRRRCRPPPVTSDSSACARPAAAAPALPLEPAGSGRTGVIADARRAPVDRPRRRRRAAGGSRLDPAWTELPVQRRFMPFMDALLNRLARGEVALARRPRRATQALLPDRVTEVGGTTSAGRSKAAPHSRPPTPGSTSCSPARDTVGALAANLDPRESHAGSRRAGRPGAGLWPGARVVALGRRGAARPSPPARGATCAARSSGWRSCSGSPRWGSPARGGARA